MDKEAASLAGEDGVQYVQAVFVRVGMTGAFGSQDDVGLFFIR